MSINVSVGVMIPVDVLEVGNEISADQLAAIQNASGATVSNPMATQSWVQSQGYSALSQDQVYAISLLSVVNSFTWNGSNWQGSILGETPYFNSNKASSFKFLMNNSYDFTPTWSGTSFSLSSMDDSSTITTTGSGESFTTKWNGTNGAIQVI
jgi:hypothetical protein